MMWPGMKSVRRLTDPPGRTRPLRLLLMLALELAAAEFCYIGFASGCWYDVGCCGFDVGAVACCESVVSNRWTYWTRSH